MDPDLTLDYVGDGPLYEQVKSFVVEHNLAHRVSLHGAASDKVKKDLLTTCGVFVQHSLTDIQTGDEEGLPAAIQEAMAYGMAVVATRHSGIPEAVEDGATGLLCNEGDADSMGRNLAAAAVDDTWRKLGAAGRSKAEKQYSWSAERKRLLACLERPAQANSASPRTP